MTEPQYRRNVLILMPESASKLCEIAIHPGNPGFEIGNGFNMRLQQQ